MPSGKKRTHEEFVQAVYAKNPTIQILGVYQKNIVPISCKCSICGHKWNPLPKSLLGGHGCPRCSNNLKLTKEEFVESLKQNNPNFGKFSLIGDYDGMSKKIKCKCHICGTEWYPKANDLIRSGSGCPSCSGNIIYTDKRFLDNLNQKNTNAPNIEILSEYKGMTKRIKCKCKICNHTWTPLASSLIQGSGCPECAKKRIAKIASEQLRKIKRPEIMPHSTFIEKFRTQNPHADTIKVCTKYNGANNSVSCKCIVCGHEWDTIASGLLSGTGCPVCSHTSTSFMEQFLLHSLTTAIGNEKVIHRSKEAIGKELDIYLPDFAFAVEIGSWNWHKKVFIKDTEKVNDCNEKGIKLIVIYDSYSNDVPLGDNFWTYKNDLGSEKEYKSLKLIVYQCLELINVSFAFSKQDWDNIISIAHQSSRRVTHDDFIEKLKTKNPHYNNMVLLSDYKYAREKIKCKCKDCGHTWETAASELLKGTGCPRCQIKAVGNLKSKKAQVLQWRKQNPTGTKIQCEKETNISRMTIYKWWDSVD